MFSLGYPELLALCALGILLFGKKLPDIARSVGKAFVAFKQGLQGIEEDVERSVAKGTESQPTLPPQRIAAAAPKFNESVAP